MWPSRPITFTGWCFCWCFSTQWPVPPSITDSQSGSQKCKVRIRSSFYFNLCWAVLQLYTWTCWWKKIWLLLLCLSFRASQQDPAAALHSGDVDEDVRLWPADLFHGAIQPLWLLCGVWRHPRDAARWDGIHPAHRHLCAALHPTAQDIQDDSVIGARV